MCLRVETHRKSKVTAIREAKKIAEKDIIVWKTVWKTKIKHQYTSLHRNFVYNKGFHYENDEFVIKHSKPRPSFMFSYIEVPGQLKIYEGLHAFKSRKWASRYDGKEVKIIKCIIPKGSEYFENQNYIVANQLIIP